MYHHLVARSQSVSEPDSLAFLRLAGDPVRWQLLRELARSDRRVQELTGLAGRPQNVISYHLAQLRSAGLVAAHPAASGDSDEATLPAFRELAAEVETRVVYLLAGLGALPA